MKIKIGDLMPNPFRNMEHYPIDKEKVEALMASIKQTGFWDNIIGRKIGDKVQIAYGHHRLVAIRKVFNTNDSVDIPVKELTDATMLKIMANENMAEWTMLPGVINETVAAAKKFLEERPEELAKVQAYKSIPSIAGIEKFLNWPEGRVRDALALLKADADPEAPVHREAAEILPTQNAAVEFASTVKSVRKDKTSKPLTREAQVRVAKKIVESKDYSPVGIRSAVIEEAFPTKKKENVLPIYHLRDEIKATQKMFRDLGTALIKLGKWKEQIREADYQVEIKALSSAANAFLETYNHFIGGMENVKKIKG